MLHDDDISTYAKEFNGRKEQNCLLSADVFLYASKWCDVYFKNWENTFCCFCCRQEVGAEKLDRLLNFTDFVALFAD